MKTSLLSCFILFSQIVFSQEIPPDLLKKMEAAGQQEFLTDTLNRYDFTAEKGKITFSNGETARFKSLMLERDSVIYRKSDGPEHKIPLSEVNFVTEIKRHGGYNALIGGATGLISGLLVGILAYPEDNILSTIVELLFQNEESEGPKISSKAIPLIVGTTAAGALLGAFVISSKNDRKVIYKKKDLTVSFVPEISASPDLHPGYMFTAKISF